jgi:nucleotide-binding universal stress UspA family protein
MDLGRRLGKLPGMILICYDGSDNAKSAIQQAGSLFTGQSAIVLTIWERFSDVMSRTTAALGMSAGMGDLQDVDDKSRSYAEQQANEGAELTRKAGLKSSPRASVRALSIGQTILAEAERADASAIVMGSRGRGGVGSFFLGSVSHDVVQAADRPVVVIPSPEIARRRTESRKARGQRG